MSKNIIDVSEHQGVIDWEKVKPHIDGAILRCGYGNDLKKQDDEQFLRNANECERLGIPYGVYLYSYADTEAKAKSEAAHILRLIEGKELSLPVYLDCEEEKAAIRSFAPKACSIIGDIIEKSGYMFGVYANLNWWNNYLTSVTKYTRWVAQYNKECQYKGTYDIWQYSSSGRVDGINGNVDMNYCYKDFTACESAPTKSVDELANEVLNGAWGNGAERKQRLTQAGYDYDVVQKRVNELVNTGYNVKVTCDALRIRSGAGTNYKQVGLITDRGIYTIVEEATGQGAEKWGKLKSGAGWIALDFTKRV